MIGDFFRKKAEEYIASEFSDVCNRCSRDRIDGCRNCQDMVSIYLLRNEGLVCHTSARTKTVEKKSYRKV